MATLLAGGLALSLMIYTITAGADYGGGVWDLFAIGPRGRLHRKIIADAIGPIWEANHVWLILVIVILFTAFPLAYSRICAFLHIPMTLMLIGIVLRGSAFAFRSYDRSGAQIRWGRIFAIASLFTPMMLGILIGTIAAGRVPVEPSDYYSTYISPWFSALPLSVGFFALSLFAFLAAVYLTMETDQQEIKEDFRKRALIAAVVSFVTGGIVLFLSIQNAPKLYQYFFHSRPGFLLMSLNGMLLLISLFTLWKRMYNISRIVSPVPVALILFGWTISQYPYLIPPQLTVADAAAPASTLRALLIGLITGSLLLFPSLLYLFRIFKKN